MSERTTKAQRRDGGRTDREVDPALAAMHEAYGLLLAAKRVPGEWVSKRFAEGFTAAACERAAHEGFEVRHPSVAYPDTVSIRWRTVA